jgi:hypothetical protein
MSIVADVWLESTAWICSALDPDDYNSAAKARRENS